MRRPAFHVSVLVCCGLILGSLGFQPSAADTVASGKHYYVAPHGSDQNAGVLASEAFETIQAALDIAQPGDTVHLEAGEYRQDFVTVRDATAEAPITVTGPEGAVVRGGGGGRIVQVRHDYHRLQGFTIDGKHGAGDSPSDYRGKLIYAMSTKKLDGVTGLEVLGMDLRNAAGECVRLRYFTTGSEIADNTITDCGIADFRFGGGGKNGEGVYIGTAPEQWGTNGAPSGDPDKSNGNHVYANIIETNGNECVDIKESSSKNLIEFNDCTGQKDKNSAGLDARGSGNTFRDNTVRDNAGAGIRFGGDTSTDGTDNDAYGNEITGNDVGGIKFMAEPQGMVCGNTFSGNGGDDAVGAYADAFKPAEECGGAVLDTQAPTAPTGLTAAAVGPRSVKLTWGAATDDRGVTGYEIFRSDDDKMVGSATTLAFEDTTVSPSSTYTYQVQAFDAAGNRSPLSSPATATTRAEDGQLISEDFSSPTAAERFKVVSGGRWRVREGVYNLDKPGSKKSGNGNVSVHVTPVAGDYLLTVDAAVKGTALVTNDFSVIFAYQNLKNYCYASFNETDDPQTSGIFRVSDGKVVEVANIAEEISADQLHGVGIEVEGEVVRVTRETSQVAAAVGSGCGDGQVGFGSRNDAARFDNLVVERRAP